MSDKCGLCVCVRTVYLYFYNQTAQTLSIWWDSQCSADDHTEFRFCFHWIIEQRFTGLQPGHSNRTFNSALVSITDPKTEVEE